MKAESVGSRQSCDTWEKKTNGRPRAIGGNSLIQAGSEIRGDE